MKIPSELKERRREYLIAVQNALGVTTMGEVAKKLNARQSTLTNLLTERSASPELAEKIERLSGVDGASILTRKAIANFVESKSEAKLSIGEWLAKESAGMIQRLQSSREDPHANIENICRSFDAMDKDDVFIYLSAITPPLEMDQNETKLKRAIAKALQRQAFFLYIMPTKEGLRSVGEYNDFATRFVDFKSEVLSNISDTEGVRSQYRDRLLFMETDANPLFTLPSFKWDLFHSSTINDVPYNAAARALVVSRQLPNFQSPGPKLLTSLAAIETKKILFEIAKTICLTNPKLPASDQVPVDIVERLKASAELAIGTKIDPN